MISQNWNMRKEVMALRHYSMIVFIKRSEKKWNEQRRSIQKHESSRSNFVVHTACLCVCIHVCFTFHSSVLNSSQMGMLLRVIKKNGCTCICMPIKWFRWLNILPQKIISFTDFKLVKTNSAHFCPYGMFILPVHLKIC